MAATAPSEGPLKFSDVLEGEQSIARCRPPGESAGLAFSGGGIRSATFNLGVIQALAEMRLLRRFDYLSTVSGGGYIGSWLTALIKRRAGGRVEDAEENIIAPAPQQPAAAGRPDPKEISGPDAVKEDRAIRWLRAYSNYLTPRLGLFSGDAQAAIATWLRNFLLNLSLLTVALATALVVPRVLQKADVWISNLPDTPHALTLLVVLFLLTFFPVLLLAYNLVGKRPTGGSAGRWPWYTRAWALGSFVVLPLMIAAWLVSGLLIAYAQDKPDTAEWMKLGVYIYGGMWALALVCVFSMEWRNKLETAKTAVRSLWQDRDARRETLLRLAFWCVKLLFFGALAGVVGGLLFKVLAVASAEFLDEHVQIAQWVLFTFGAPAVIVALMLVVVIHIGLMARNFSDEHHEFWARIGGQFQRAILAWMAVAGTAAFSAPLIDWLSGWISGGGGLAWIATTVAGVLLGKSPATGGAQGPSKWRELLTRVAPYVFVAGFLGLVAWGIQTGFTRLDPEGASTCASAEGPGPGAAQAILLYASPVSGAPVLTREPDGTPTQLDRLLRQVDINGCLMGRVPGDLLWATLGGLVLLTLLLGHRINVNLYSIHKFYRNRLMRCYGGATNDNRQPNPVTGFDPGDDIQLKDLVQKPYHILNTAINLNAGRQLAWQRRRAASFTFTPLHAGYEPASRVHKSGYRPTAEYSVDVEGNSAQIGMAVAASGAAVSPNSGFHTSPAVAFLLTVFDVRLGRWCGDPGGKTAWRKEDPWFSLRYWLAETTGQADAELPFVYLTDGGHFENLGVYELVRRRCKLIVVCDAGADPKCIFDDLGEAIRKCYVDFGVEIRIDIKPIVPSRRTGYGKAHHALGEILYENAKEPSRNGQILYVKASLTEDLPTDLRHYKSEQPDFPHQSTADQFFDETQFESYRKLGYESMKKAVAEVRQRADCPVDLA